MATHKEIRSFFYREDMIEITDFLLKRYEPTNLDKLDILCIIYPVIKKHYKELTPDEKVSLDILKKTDDVIRRHLFPKSYVQKESCDKLFDKWVKGDIKSFDKLVERNLHLPSLTLSRLEYSSPFDEDLFEIAIETLILNIKKYDKAYSKCISSYLNDKVYKALASKVKERNKNNQEKKIDLSSLKPNTVILHYSDSSDSSDYGYDNVNDYVETESFNLFKKNILKTPYLSFLEKTSIMAKFGFINNFDITYKELAICFNTSYQNLQIAIKKGLKKLQEHKNINNVNYDYSLFEYFSTDKRIVLICMSNLSTEQVELLKCVWGEDFYNLKKLEDVNFTEEQVVLYYKAIATIYNQIKKCKSNIKNTIVSDNKNIYIYETGNNQEKGQAFIKK